VKRSGIASVVCITRTNQKQMANKSPVTPFLQYPETKSLNSGWETDFTTDDSPIGAYLTATNIPWTALPCHTLGSDLLDYESDADGEADVSAFPTPVTTPPKQELAAMPTLEEIFWDLLVLDDHNHLGPPWFC
jgi:hypothetical protein